MSESSTKELVDPRERFPRPPFAQLKMAAPGSEGKMHPHPDHGEESYTGSGKLLGRAALITGGDSGIGRAIALCYAKEGADILFTCLPEEKADADETVRLVEATGRRAVALPGDIRQKAFCQHLVEQTVSTFGRLDILVNNAAFQRSCDKLEDFTEEDFDATFRTNVYGTFFMSQAAIPKMKPGGVGHQHRVHPRLRSVRESAAIRLHQGGADQHDQDPGRARHQERGTCQRGGPGAGVDAAHPCYPAAHRRRSCSANSRRSDVQPSRSSRRSFTCFWRPMTPATSRGRFTERPVAGRRFDPSRRRQTRRAGLREEAFASPLVSREFHGPLVETAQIELA